jgi:lipoprotein-releasing system ATP-binding protein
MSAGLDVSFVTVRGLNKSYVVGHQRIHVLRDLELDVDAGEMVAVVGASGVGKSTLLHLLGGLDRSDSGVIHVVDTELTAMPDAALVEFRNRNVGFVFQFHHLLPEFDAAENVAMPMRIARIPNAAAHERAAELLRRVGLGERLAHRPGMLSGGEQQRVAVARALVMRPSLLSPRGISTRTPPSRCINCCARCTATTGSRPSLPRIIRGLPQPATACCVWNEES